jgi:hypothetical protein
MIEHVINTGDRGRLKIIDRSGEPHPMVEFWIQSLSPIGVRQIPWAYSINNDRSAWQSFRFRDQTVWQPVRRVALTYGETATMYLGATNSSELGGPTQFTVKLVGGLAPRLVLVKVGTQHVKAIPYVRVNGVWQVTQPLIRTDRGWRETV